MAAKSTGKVNPSPYKDVRLTASGRWTARLRQPRRNGRDGKSKGLGSYETAEMAARAVDLARLKAGLDPLNFPEDVAGTEALADTLQQMLRTIRRPDGSRSMEFEVRAARREWLRRHGYTAATTVEDVVADVLDHAHEWTADRLTLADSRWIVDFFGIPESNVNRWMGRGVFPPPRRPAVMSGRSALWHFEPDVMRPILDPATTQSERVEHLLRVAIADALALAAPGESGAGGSKVATG